MSQRLNIAVIGTGIAGLSAAHVLDKHHQVTLFERNNYIGGHTNTVTLSSGPDEGLAIDTGFIVYNDRNYPTLTRLFDQLGIQGQPSDMSFGFHSEKKGSAYSSYFPGGLFAYRRNLLNPSFLRMITDILRFNKKAKEDLNSQDIGEQSLGDYLKAFSGGQKFQEDYLLPMGAAIWSTPPGEMLNFPAQTFLRFFNNHGLLEMKGRPRWMTVPGGSFQYIKKILDSFKGEVRTSAEIGAIQRSSPGVKIHLKTGQSYDFDRAVIGTHANEGYRLLDSPTTLETELLAPWQYTRNRTVLHTDDSVMPSNKRAWASWNYTVESTDKRGKALSLTYHMNRLQSLKTSQNYFVTLNRETPIASDKIIREILYTHPMYTRQSMRTQSRLQELNDAGPIYFCGSYFGYGFHEDAIKSSEAVLKRFGLNL